MCTRQFFAIILAQAGGFMSLTASAGYYSEQLDVEALTVAMGLRVTFLGCFASTGVCSLIRDTRRV